jgi:hypothetical protein
LAEREYGDRVISLGKRLFGLRKIGKEERRSMIEGFFIFVIKERIMYLYGIILNE